MSEYSFEFSLNSIKRVGSRKKSAKLFNSSSSKAGVIGYAIHLTTVFLAINFAEIELVKQMFESVYMVGVNWFDLVRPLAGYHSNSSFCYVVDLISVECHSYKPHFCTT